MATAETIICQSDTRKLPQISRKTAVIATAGLTLISIAIQGYHPYAEDGGLYLCEIKKALDPGLYPGWSQFVTAQAKFSFFAPVLAAVEHVSHLPLMILMLLVYAASIWATLIAGWMIASRCFQSLRACYGATSLLALWLTLPVAGTSLMLMDPYVTARSLSTPCALFAFAFAMDVCEALRGGTKIPWGTVALSLLFTLIAELMHPLMATYALGCIILLVSAAATNARWRTLTLCGLCGLGVIAAAVLYWSTPPAAADYLRVAQTRTYWFIDRWEWYEQFGLAAPLAMLAVIPRLVPKAMRPGLRSLAQMTTAAGVTGILIATAFARQSVESYSVARLQPLRIFQLIYALMILLLGGAFAERVLRKDLKRWVAFFVIAGVGVWFCQLQIYPSSAHLELPWEPPQNQWEQAFQWIRENTPRNSLFAMDSNYITAAGEDSQNFRAIAERSALPDYSKDGGVAAIAPQLAGRWAYGESIDANLDKLSDVRRTSRLEAAGADWVVLSGSTATEFLCPYANPAVKICLSPSASATQTKGVSSREIPRTSYTFVQPDQFEVPLRR